MTDWTPAECPQDSGIRAGHQFMLTTMHLTETESNEYRGQRRVEVRAAAVAQAERRGSRFVQVVAADGRILDVLEVR